MFLNLGYLEILIIAAVALFLLTGSSKISDSIKSLGKGLREYHKITGEIKETFSLNNFFDDHDSKK